MKIKDVETKRVTAVCS